MTSLGLFFESLVRSDMRDESSAENFELGEAIVDLRDWVEM